MPLTLTKKPLLIVAELQLRCPMHSGETPSETVERVVGKLSKIADTKINGELSVPENGAIHLEAFSSLQEHADWPREDWQYEVANGDTVLGYADWVYHRILANHE